jgi:hypothetical protein
VCPPAWSVPSTSNVLRKTGTNWPVTVIQLGFDVVLLAAFAGLVKSRVRRNDTWRDEP